MTVQELYDKLEPIVAEFVKEVVESEGAVEPGHAATASMASYFMGAICKILDDGNDELMMHMAIHATAITGQYMQRRNLEVEALKKMNKP